MKNDVSVELTDEQMTSLNDSIKAIEDIVGPITIVMNADAKRKLPLISDPTIGFVQKCFDYMQQNPLLLPAYINLEEVGKDVETITTLRPVQQRLDALQVSLNDTVMAAGSEAYQACLAFYDSVKRASRNNVANATAIEADLKTQFSKTKSSSKTTV